MAKQVIHIIGASGAGTTTLARYISETLGYHAMDTDDYYWMPTDPPFTVKRPVPERIALMKAEIDAYDKVVLSGSMTRWGDELVPYFTLVVLVLTDTSLRLKRIHERELARFGSRILPGGDMYEQHQSFLQWAASYDTESIETRSRANHDAWLKTMKCPVLTLNGADTPEHKLALVRAMLP